MEFCKCKKEGNKNVQTLEKKEKDSAPYMVTNQIRSFNVTATFHSLFFFCMHACKL